MSSPVGPPSISLKGGNSIWYSTRLMILLGGQIKASTKKLTAETKGTKYNWGIQTKIKTMKNQLPSPWTVTYEGEVICSPHGMISIEKDSISLLVFWVKFILGIDFNFENEVIFTHFLIKFNTNTIDY